MSMKQHLRVPANTRTSYTADLGVYIGRFQPFHLGHLHIVIEALKRVRYLTILVGSSCVPRSYFNPFTFEERRAMILASLPVELRGRVFVQPLLDMTYNDPAWVVQVQEKAKGAAEHFFPMDGDSVALVGYQKDGTSFYLKMFPQWESIAVPAFVAAGEDKPLSATPIREGLFDRTAYEVNAVYLPAHALPDEVIQVIAEFSDTREFENLVEEYEYVKRYKSQFEGLSYPPIFQTVDALVVQSGHILLVKRKSRPGRGLWALPGGFLNAHERIVDAVYRELREETKIKVPDAVLRGSTVARETFDDVHRSARGRTITSAFLIRLPDGPLPKVKGADDAEKAKWVPLSEVTQDKMFEDHFHVIKKMTGMI